MYTMLLEMMHDLTCMSLVVPEGYEYQGQVKFTTKRYPLSPLKGLDVKAAPRNLSKPLYSILVTSSGHKFTKR